ncbi:hypothetical protein PGB90_000405 [Kerria lacca]
MFYTNYNFYCLNKRINSRSIKFSFQVFSDKHVMPKPELLIHEVYPLSPQTQRTWIQ